MLSNYMKLHRYNLDEMQRAAFWLLRAACGPQAVCCAPVF